MNADVQDYKVGYFPTTMPRDPVEIDIYLEHVGVGQVIETLLKLDDQGELISNIAESWTIKDDGKAFIFKLRENILFSNGNRLTTKDVKFTIQRHKDSETSQSKTYLENIKEIRCVSDYVIEFQLRKPQVSFLKILSRDHLGIVPAGWVFDKKSKEPWIGTGAYRFIQDESSSYFIKNSLYRNEKNVQIAKWKILKSDDVIRDALTLDTPHLVMHTSNKVKDHLKSLKVFNGVEFSKPLHFIQTSIWWYPGGKNYLIENKKKQIMTYMNALVLELQDKNQFELSSGVIPRGIQGHLKERIVLELPKKNERELKIKVTVYANDFDSFFGNENYKEFEKKYNVKFEISKFNFIENNPIETKPDVLISAYAGGFPDPDGFLIVLGSILNVEGADYLKDVSHIYNTASQEQDWTRRGSLFRQINEHLVRNLYMVPAWKREMFIGKSTHLIDAPSLFSYTVKLERFSNK